MSHVHKKIKTMKAKNWFVTLISLTLLPLTVSAGESTDSYCVASGLGLDEIPISGVVGTSGAIYSGKVGYDGDYPCFIMDQTYVYATTTSPGTAKTVSITWADDDEFYNTVSESTIYVYGRHSAFDGSETKGDLDAAGVTCIGSIVYAGVFGTSALDVSAGSYEYIAIVGGATQSGVQCVSVTWTVEDVVTYTLTASVTGKGKVSFTPSSPVAEGTPVKVTFKGSGTELHSYSINNGPSVIDAAELDEDEYAASFSTTFTMPAGNVNVTALFGATPARVANPISVNGDFATYATTIQSGEEEAITVATTYNAGTSPAYNRTLKSVESSNTNIVEVVGNTFNAASGEGIVTLRGKTTGSASVLITTYQTSGTLTSQRTINVTVVSRNVALVTELNGKYYAVTNSPSGATVAAVELFEDGGYYYYKSAGDLSNISWKAENTADGYYIRNSADQYLKVAGATMSLSGSTYEWYKNAGDAFVTGYTTGMCYDESYSAFVITGQNDHSSVSTISACVHEIPVASLALATEYPRSLTNGNYATMCLPFAVSASETFFSGAEVYIIVGKHVSAGNVTGIELEQVTDNLVAGKPYVILATASTLSAWHGDDLVGSPVNGDGLVGNLNSTPLIMPDGTYGISGNKLRKINGGTGKVNQYRAYIDLDGIPEVSPTPTPAPGRRVIVAENGTDSENQENIGTSLEDLLNNATSIDWNQPVYNTLGQRVGKGTTGVLIQNGKKFLVQ